MFADLAMRFCFLTLCKTYQVYICSVVDKAGIPAVIHQISISTGRKIELLVFCAHGTDDCMQLGGIFTEQDITPEESEDLDFYARIVAISCRTGNLLGPRLSRAFNRPVSAPMTDIRSRHVFVDSHNEICSTCPFVKFYPDGTSLRIDHPNTNWQYEWDYRQYIKINAESGDAFAQLRFAIFLERNGEGEKAEDFFNRAAVQGLLAAQKKLGRFYEKRGIFFVAEYWLRKAAAQDDVEAKLLLGRIMDKREIALNMLGYVFQNEGQSAIADDYFRKADSFRLTLIC